MTKQVIPQTKIKRVKCISTKVPASEINSYSGKSYYSIWLGEIYEVVNEYENSYYICPNSEFCFEYEKILFEVVESEESEITSEESTVSESFMKEQFLIEYVMNFQNTNKPATYVVDDANKVWKLIQAYCKE